MKVRVLPVGLMTSEGFEVKNDEVQPGFNGVSGMEVAEKISMPGTHEYIETP